jgi:hypothetical protein
MKPLAKIRAACIAANPEIVQLKFGCRVRYQGENWNVARLTGAAQIGVLLAHPDGEEVTRFEDTRTSTREKFGFEIIGRPITLADVLLPIGDRQGRLRVDSSGWFEAMDNTDNQFIRTAHWNLRVSLEDQSEGTIEFIAALL